MTNMTLAKKRVKNFNKKHKVGNYLYVTNDLGEVEERLLISQAWLIPSGQGLANFAGIVGGYDITRARNKEEQNALLTDEITKEAEEYIKKQEYKDIEEDDVIFAAFVAGAEWIVEHKKLAL